MKLKTFAVFNKKGICLGVFKTNCKTPQWGVDGKIEKVKGKIAEEISPKKYRKTKTGKIIKVNE